MNRLPMWLIAVALLYLSLSVMGCSCYVETNKDRSLAAMRVAEIKLLLVAVEQYIDTSGKRPSSLTELQASRSDIENITLTDYSYYPDGLVVADGTRWLISAPDPMKKGSLIVGTLPIEVDSKVLMSESSSE
jgi:hypothetical protein